MRIYQMSDTTVPRSRQGKPIKQHSVWLSFYSTVLNTYPKTGYQTYCFASCTLVRWLRDEFSTQAYDMISRHLFLTDQLGHWLTGGFEKIILTRLESLHWQAIPETRLDEIPREIFANGENDIVKNNPRIVSDHHRWKTIEVADSFFNDLANEYRHYRKKRRRMRAQWFAIGFLAIILLMYWRKH